MTKLDSRISKIEKAVHGTAAMRTFTRIVSSVVSRVDPNAGRNLGTLIAARDREFIENPEKLMTTLASLINSMNGGTREAIIENLVRLKADYDGGPE